MGSEGLSDGRVPEGKADHFHVPLKVKKGWIYNSSIRLYVVALCLPKQKVNSQSNPCAGPEGPRRFRHPDFDTVGTRRW